MTVDETNCWQYSSLSEIKIDTSRKVRTGLPEAILARGKSDSQLLQIAKFHTENSLDMLITRCTEAQIELIVGSNPQFQHSNEAGCVWHKFSAGPDSAARVCILTGGSSDIQVAREAEITIKLAGFDKVEVMSDIGVANLSRSLSYLEHYQAADVIIICAGMEGALPSVIAGLTHSSIIAVPTSGGTGGDLAGIPALLAMLNSCAPGVAVVNIDGGYQAACVAIRTLNLIKRT